MENLNKIKIFIILMIIIIIAIVVIIFNLSKNKNNNDNTNNFEEDDIGFTYEVNENNFSDFKDPTIFYSVLNALDEYLTILENNLQEVVYDREIYTEDQRKQVLYSLLDVNYIKKNNISKKNILEYIGEDQNYKNLIPIEMKVKYNNKTQTYITRVYRENREDGSLKEKMYIIRIDNANSSFSIEPVDEEYTAIDEVKVLDEVDSIQSNNNNKYEVEDVYVEQLVEKYIENYKYLIINHPNIVYDYYLKDSYKSIFNDVDDFINYVQQNKDSLSNLRIIQYEIENDGEKTIYKCYDENNNLYIIEEEATMKYTIEYKDASQVSMQQSEENEQEVNDIQQDDVITE